MRWSSISLASFRASSTGCTWVRNARPKTPSKSDSSFDSMFRSTFTGEGLSTPSASLASVYAPKSMCRSGPPRTTHRFQPIRETRTCQCQNCAESVPRGRLLASAAALDGDEGAGRPAGDDERQRRSLRRSQKRPGQERGAEDCDREVTAARDEGKHPGSRSEDQRLEPESRGLLEPAPDCVDDCHRPLGAGDC